MNEGSWELPQVFEPTQAPTSAIEEVEQNTLSQKEVDDQNLTEDQSSSNDEKTMIESKDVSKQAAKSVIITSCVADEPEEFPIQEPGKLPSTSYLLHRRLGISGRFGKCGLHARAPAN